MTKREYESTLAFEIENLDAEIKNLPDKEIVAFIESADSWDAENVTGAMCYLARSYDVSMIDDDGEWKSSDDVLAEIKAEM